MPGPVSFTALFQLAIGCAGADFDRSDVGKLYRVTDQIDQHLGQAPFVAERRWDIGHDGGLELNALGLRQRTGCSHYVFDQRLNGIIREVKIELPGLYFGQVEHIVDQAEKMPAVRLNARQRFGGGFR